MGNSTNGTSYLGPSSYFQIPNTQLPGGIDYYFYSLNCERLQGDILSGIGTIVHEFCHSLGLPDLYPFGSGTAFSTVDEWDLMDGGNMTNYGWCPPNLSAMERMYLGWDAPEELTVPTTVEGMKPRRACTFAAPPPVALKNAICPDHRSCPRFLTKNTKLSLIFNQN